MDWTYIGSREFENDKVRIQTDLDKREEAAKSEPQAQSILALRDHWDAFIKAINEFEAKKCDPFDELSPARGRYFKPIPGYFVLKSPRYRAYYLRDPVGLKPPLGPVAVAAAIMFWRQSRSELRDILESRRKG